MTTGGVFCTQLYFMRSHDHVDVVQPLDSTQTPNRVSDILEACAVCPQMAVGHNGLFTAGPAQPGLV